MILVVRLGFTVMVFLGLRASLFSRRPWGHSLSGSAVSSLRWMIMVHMSISAAQAEVSHEVDIDDPVFVLVQQLFIFSGGLPPVVLGQLDDGFLEHGVRVDVVGEVFHHCHELFPDLVGLSGGAVVAQGRWLVRPRVISGLIAHWHPAFSAVVICTSRVVLACRVLRSWMGLGQVVSAYTRSWESGFGRWDIWGRVSFHMTGQDREVDAEEIILMSPLVRGDSIQAMASARVLTMTRRLMIELGRELETVLFL